MKDETTTSLICLMFHRAPSVADHARLTEVEDEIPSGGDNIEIMRRKVQRTQLGYTLITSSRYKVAS